MRRPRTEGKLRTWLAKTLGREDIPDALWQRLLDRGYVRDALDDDQNNLAELVDEARELLDFAGQVQGLKRPGRRTPSSRADWLLTAAESRRAQAFSEYLGRLAHVDPAVVRFRQENLGGETLSGKEAEKLLALPSLYLLPREEFAARSIPVCEHRVRASRTRKQLPGGRFQTR